MSLPWCGPGLGDLWSGALIRCGPTQAVYLYPRPPHLRAARAGTFCLFEASEARIVNFATVPRQDGRQIEHDRFASTIFTELVDIQVSVVR